MVEFKRQRVGKLTQPERRRKIVPISLANAVNFNKLRRQLNKEGVKRAYKKYRERRKPAKLQGFQTGKDKNEIRNRYSETDFINVHISCQRPLNADS